MGGGGKTAEEENSLCILLRWRLITLPGIHSVSRMLFSNELDHLSSELSAWRHYGEQRIHTQEHLFSLQRVVQRGLVEVGQTESAQAKSRALTLLSCTKTNLKRVGSILGQWKGWDSSSWFLTPLFPAKN